MDASECHSGHSSEASDNHSKQLGADEGCFKTYAGFLKGDDKEDYLETLEQRKNKQKRVHELMKKERDEKW